MADWDYDSGSPAIQASAAAASGGSGVPVVDEVADRTSIITGRLKTIYRKTVLPVEKRFQYDYFYESPFMTDVEFDGTYNTCTVDFICDDCYVCSYVTLRYVTLCSLLNVMFSCYCYCYCYCEGLFNIFCRPLMNHSQASSYANWTVQCWKNVLHSVLTRKRLSRPTNRPGANHRSFHCVDQWTRRTRHPR